MFFIIVLLIYVDMQQQFVCLPWSEVCSARVKSLILLVVVVLSLLSNNS